MSHRTEAFTALRERWKAALPVGVIAVYANWKPGDDVVRPDPGTSLWVEETIAPGASIDSGIVRDARFREVRGSVQLEVRSARDVGVKPALDLVDILETALLVGAPSYLADTVTPVLVYDTAVQPVRDEAEWFMIPLVVFYTYTVALVAA